LYCSKEASEFLLPDRTGGENAMLSDGNNIAYAEMPARLQAGFRNYPGAAGLESSLRYVLRLNIENIRAKNAAVARALRDELASIPSVKFYGQEDPKLRTSIVSFTIPELDSTDVVKRLERDGVVLADREVGIIGPGDQSIKAIRASPHFFNTEEEASSVARWIRSYCS
jgi:cysteine desulfurase/selenocysteine lyase